MGYDLPHDDLSKYGPRCLRVTPDALAEGEREMSVTMAAGLVIVLTTVTSVTAFSATAEDDRYGERDTSCRPYSPAGQCPPPPSYVVGSWSPEGSPAQEWDPASEDSPDQEEGPAREEAAPDEGVYSDEGPHEEDGSYESDARDASTAPLSRRRMRGLIALSAAREMIGTPFSWGGGSRRGPTYGIAHGSDTVGFDCSGLTLYAWSRAGVKLAHYTGTQFRQGRSVGKRNLRPGDLVFFGASGGDPNHVGLNVGEGVMIHAPQTGEVVKRTNFEKSAYYGPRYRGAVRP
jgi:cell wall-associated NlpC family hydrolase